MNKQLIIFTGFLLYGIYCLVMGWLNLKFNKEILDLTSVAILWYLRLTKGADAARQHKTELVRSKNFKVISRFALATGFLSIAVAIYIGIQM
jgi:hypothetical protein